MTSKKQDFHYVRFSPTTLRAIEKQVNHVFREQVLEWVKSSNLADTHVDAEVIKYDEMMVSVPSADGRTEEWRYDTPDQFFPALRKDYTFSRFRVSQSFWTGIPISVILSQWTTYVELEVSAPTPELVESIAAIFEDAAERSSWGSNQDEVAGKPQIFIGHGGQSNEWRTLLIDLQSRHGLVCEAFETGSRAGHSIRDILNSLLEANSFALLVLSKEDEQIDGNFRARQNVVHEAGLFQGRLGFGRAIIVVEEGTELLSNLGGIQHLSYPKGRITAVVGDVLATLNREFPA